MAYSVVSAGDLNDLMGEIQTFAVAQGWTVTWNTGSQMGLTNGKNCFAAFGLDGTTNPVVVTDTYPDPDVNYNDFRIRGALGKDFVGHASQYWGLTGSLATTATDADTMRQNDLGFPMSEVHLFGTIDYIWILMKVAGDRYTHFGFGTFDKKGMTHPDCAFMGMQFWYWWDMTWAVGGRQRKNTMNFHSVDPGNDMFFDNAGQNLHVYVPDAVVDPSTGVIDDAVYANASNMIKLFQFSVTDITTITGSEGTILSHWDWAMNKPVTGGVPLLSIPFFLGDNTSDSNLIFLGDFPGVRLCRINNLAIGEEITYGSETWKVFPIKRKTGQDLDGGASSYGYGLAFLKES